MVRDFPHEFDAVEYRAIHADLWHLDDAELRDHYEATGRVEGRRANSLQHREQFARLADGADSILEIGPFARPLFRGKNVRYFDVLDREGLMRLAEELEVDEKEQIPEIDYVSPTGDLKIVSETFDVIASSHAIEHQPDLVGHLNRVTALLRPGGFYFVWIPDKRYCFDYYHPESSIGEVILAAQEQRIFHTLGTLIEQAVQSAHNEPARHWRGDHGAIGRADPDSLQAIVTQYEGATRTQTYIDRHAWQFTPDSFRSIIRVLWDLKFISLQIVRLYPTRWGSNEFWAILEHIPQDRCIPAIGMQHPTLATPISTTPIPSADQDSRDRTVNVDPQEIVRDRDSTIYVCRGFKEEVTLANRLVGRIRLEVDFAWQDAPYATFKLQFASGMSHVAYVDMRGYRLHAHDLLHVSVRRTAEQGLFTLEASIAIPDDDALISISVAPDDANEWRMQVWHMWDALKPLPAAFNVGKAGIHVVRAAPAGIPAGRPKRQAVLIATYVPVGALQAGMNLLAALRQHHPDSKIFAGVNHGSCAEWSYELENCGLDLEVHHVADTITTRSEAAGFVAALTGFRACPEDFSLVWFGHTKGTSNAARTRDLSYQRVLRAVDRRFWSQRDEITGYFNNPRVGLYAPHQMVCWAGNLANTMALKQALPSSFQPLAQWAVTAFFVLRGELVRAFCSLVPEAFFLKGVEAIGGNYHFFEDGFPAIASLAGYEPWIPDGAWGTTLPGSAGIDRNIWADEQQNHALLRRELERWRKSSGDYVPGIAYDHIEWPELMLHSVEEA